MSVDPPARAVDEATDSIASHRLGDRSGAPSTISAGEHSCFLRRPVPVDALRPLGPPRLQPETFVGIAYVGLVRLALSGNTFLGR